MESLVLRQILNVMCISVLQFDGSKFVSVSNFFFFDYFVKSKGCISFY